MASTDLDSLSLMPVGHAWVLPLSIFVTIDAPDPSELVLKVMTDVYDSGENMFKSCIKIQPFTHACLATLDEMGKLATELVPKHFPEGTI